MTDMVNHPPHYTDHPVFTGECHDLCTMLSFDAGNAVKYLWRWNRKGEPAENIRKALWYIDHTEQPFRLMGRWDNQVEQRIYDETSEYVGAHVGHRSVEVAAALAILSIVKGDLRNAEREAQKALHLINEGKTA